MSIEQKIITTVTEIITRETGQEIDPSTVVLQKTRKDFEGDITLVVFPFLKLLRRSPEQCADLLGAGISERLDEVAGYNVLKGFLNIVLNHSFWFAFLKEQAGNEKFGFEPAARAEQLPVMVEFSSPNTNKPLHLGHIRNNLLGCSVSNLLQAAGHRVVRVNLVNDRGIHICKSMLAWMKWGNGETPQSTGKKGDKLVGDYYVKFETELRNQVKTIVALHRTEEEAARKNAPLMQEAQNLLRRWEERDPEVVKVWKMMNDWVYEGFDATYAKMGISFDKVYYESDTYLLGRDIVLDGLKKGKLIKKEDGSVWADLSNENLDEKLLLRADGTSVYMTQDIGTAELRYNDFLPAEMVYVVGNEQNYHFDVLAKILKKLDKPYADDVFHLSYGMVELPAGRMKSREGTVVDADDLITEMNQKARQITEELGKTHDFNEDEKSVLYHTIAMGALKYFILKVDPKKNMMFNPDESIDFDGNTGPFIQYTYARIASIMRSAGRDRVQAGITGIDSLTINSKEVDLLKTLYGFPKVIMDAANDYSPAQIANYVYELCKEYNRFYHDHSVLNEPDRQVSDFRLQLSRLTATTVRNAMLLLGIDVPERM